MILRNFWKGYQHKKRWLQTSVNVFSSSIFARLQDLGVSKSLIEQAEQNSNISKHLEEFYGQLGSTLCSDKRKANLVISLSSKLSPSLEQQKWKLAEYIANEQINSNADLEKALGYVKDEIKRRGQLDWNLFESNMGIGRKLSDEDVVNEIVTQLEEIPNLNREQLRNDKKYASLQLRIIRDALKHIEAKLLFQHFDKAVEKFLNLVNAVSHGDTSISLAGDSKSIYMQEDQQIHIWDKIASLRGRDLCQENNSEKAYQKHLSETNGIKYILRFPPEPNGYLHLGHAKALRTNFYSAEKLGGICYLRYDDTNPEKEKQDYIDSIKDNILWFGFKPYKITYSSDYFHQIYECALTLIKKGLAYACEVSHEQMVELRHNKQASPFRERSIDDNLRLFEGMKEGKFKENEMCLRLKIDYKHSNPTMRDPVIYRVKYHPHPRTHREWNMYPLYDFTHCLCDSIENITHSLCTLEFEIRRDLYYWILDSLDMYKPVVWEYSRLNVSNSVLSKRKLLKLISHHVVQGWDDPRLLTINALRRRGVRPSAISNFVDLVNVTRSGNENIIDQRLLDFSIRQDLSEISPRTMAIIEPIQLQIINFKDFHTSTIQVPLFPNQTNSLLRKITVSSILAVDASDVREQNYLTKNQDPEINASNSTSIDGNSLQKNVLDSEGKNKQKKSTFIGLYPGSRIALKYFGVIDVLSVDLKSKTVTCNLVSLEEKDRRETTGQIHWINPEEAVECEVRIYNDLFKVEDPNSFDNILDAVNPNSLEIHTKSLIHKDTIENMVNSEQKTFQFERLGYFTVDSASNNKNDTNKLVFHRTVSLKDRINRSQL